MKLFVIQIIQEILCIVWSILNTLWSNDLHFTKQFALKPSPTKPFLWLRTNKSNLWKIYFYFSDIFYLSKYGIRVSQTSESRINGKSQQMIKLYLKKLYFWKLFFLEKTPARVTQMYSEKYSKLCKVLNFK